MKKTKKSDIYILWNQCGKDVCKNPPLGYDKERNETYCNDAGTLLFKGSPLNKKHISIKEIKKKIKNKGLD